jgi:hypothetical protein
MHLKEIQGYKTNFWESAPRRLCYPCFKRIARSAISAETANLEYAPVSTSEA